MDWDTVAQVLVILAAAGAYQRFTFRRTSQPDPVEAARTRELRALERSSRRLVRKHSRMAAAGYRGRARTAWEALRDVDHRAALVRADLDKQSR